MFSNVFDVLIRVDKTGTKLEPGLAESWTISEDGLTYTFKIRDAKFSDGSPITAGDAAFSLLHIRDNKGSLWADSYKVVDTATAADDRTLVVKLKNPSEPFLATQLAKAGVTVNINKVDPSQEWDMLVAGDYDVGVNYWTNDILDPDQKTTFVVGHDSNMNYMTRYKNDKVKDLVAAARLELDPAKRDQMYVEIQKMAKDDVNWIDLYYSPYINVSRNNIENFYQNPLGRFFLEDTVKN